MILKRNYIDDATTALCGAIIAQTLKDVAKAQKALEDQSISTRKRRFYEGMRKECIDFIENGAVTGVFKLDPGYLLSQVK